MAENMRADGSPAAGSAGEAGAGGRPAVHAAGTWTSLRQQAWLLWKSRRWAFLVLAFVALLALISAGEEPSVAPELLIAALVLLPAAPIWAMLVWSGEAPEGRSYHWSLPVSRPVHDLVRVALGAVALLAAYAILAAVGAIIAATAGGYDRFAAIGSTAWAGFFFGPLILYLLVMPAVLWGDHPATRWTLGIVAGVPILAVVLQWIGAPISLEPVAEIVFVTTRYSLGPAVLDGIVDALVNLEAGAAGPPTGLWLTATVVWLVLGTLLTILAATFRPADVKRLMGPERS